MNNNFTKFLFLIVGMMLTFPAYGTVKRLKSFSSTRQHYVAEISYDSSSRINQINVRGIQGDSQGNKINQILTIDWNGLENGSLSMNVEGTGPFHSEKIDFSSDGNMVAAHEYWIYSNGSIEVTESTFSYYPDGYCSEMIMGTSEPERFIYYWNDGDVVRIDVEYDDNYSIEVATSTATYTSTVYPQGAEIVAAIIDDEALDFEFPWTAIFSGKMKSSKHFVKKSNQNDFKYDFSFDTDNEGYPIHVIETPDNPDSSSSSFYFEWENVAGFQDNLVDAQDKKDYYSIEGVLLEAPTRGINIVRHSNGYTEKVIIK